MSRLQDPRAPGKAGVVIRTSVELPQESITVIAARPAMISQNTVEAHFSLDARGFLEVIRSPGFPLHVIKLRKLRLVSYGDFLAWLRGLASPASQARAESSPANDADEEEDPDASAMQLEAELGLERTKPGLKRTGAKGRP
jgi:hypothetical protein